MNTRTIVGLLTIAIAIGLVGGALLIRFVHQRGEDIEAIAETNRAAIEERKALACATADLIAHVPAVQFAGEPLSNFLGWIKARADVLEAAKAADTCEPTVVRALERRIDADNSLLGQLDDERN